MSFGFGFGFPKADTAAAGGVPGGGASLRLNFLDSTTLDPRVTFSRTSNATVFDNTGELIYAPHNLLTNSESLDNSVWLKIGTATVAANTARAPDGTTTADTLILPASSDRVNPAAVSIAGGATYVFSVWLAGSGTVNITLATSGGTYTVATQQISLTPTLTRYSVAINTLTTNTGLFCVIGRYDGFAGTGTATFCTVWGAQLNVANAPGDNLLTFSEEFDNAAWTKTNSSIQSNLITFSEQFDNAAWAKTRSFIQTNQIRNNTMQGAVAGTPGTLPTNWAAVALGVSRQVVGSGVANGVAYIDIRFFGTPSSSADIQVLFEPNNGIAATNLTTYTESVFVALVGGSLTNISAVRLAVGTYSAAAAFLEYLTGASISGSITSTMQRFSASVTTNNASTAFAQPAIGLSATSGQAVDFTLRIGWPQLVLGAVAGDPVPTYGVARAVMYAAPDGSITADKLSEDISAAATHTVSGTASGGIVVGVTYTFSVYAKAAERTIIDLAGMGFTAQGFNAIFNLADGTIISNSGSRGSIAPVGNGWYRCSIFVTASSTTAPIIQLFNAAGNNIYTGDGTSGIYVWGAQLVQGTVPYDYVRTDATPVAIGYSAPDATMTADKLVENTATGQHFVNVAGIATSSGTLYTASIYMKAAERTFAAIEAVLTTGGVEGVFNLTAETVTLSSYGGAPSPTGSITNAGGGWYRCVITFAANGASTALRAAKLYQNATTQSYTGDGVSGVLIWGAQLNVGATALPYVETTNSIYPTPSYNDTTVQNLLGFTQEFDNAAWNKSNSFIQTNLLTFSEQIDNAAWGKSASYIQTNLLTFSQDIDNAVWTKSGSSIQTNLLTYSQQFDNAAWAKSASYIQTNLLTYSQQFDNTSVWAVTASSVSANVAVAPDGTTTADGLIENTATTDHLITRAAIPIARDVQRTHSIYVKANGRTSVRLQDNAFSGNFARADYNLSGGTVSNIVASGAAVIGGTSITNVGNGWFRCTLTVIPNPTAGGGSDLTIRTLIGDVANYTGDGVSGVFLWGAQTVQGAVPGDYQQTLGTAAAVQYLAPDASITADKLSEDTNTGAHNVVQTATIADNTVATMSVYIKPDGRSWVAVSVADKAGVNNRVWFNVTTGVQGTTNGTVTAFSANPMGGGWYRISVSASVGTGGFSPGTRISLGPADNTPSYTGDGTSGVYVWGAQLVLGAAASTYQETVASALPIPYTAPDGSRTAEKIVEDTANSTHFVRQTPSGTVNTLPLTFTIYAKAAERSALILAIQEGSPFTSQANVLFDLASGTAGTVSNIGGAGSSSASIQPVGDGWYRCILTTTLGGSATSVLAWSYLFNGSNTYTGNGSSGLLVWGAQLVQGAVPGDYQVTYGGTSAVGYLTPDSSFTAEKFVADTTTVEHFCDQSFSVVAGNTYTVSAYFKAGGLTDVGLRFIVGALWTGGLSPLVGFNLLNETASVLGGFPSGFSITPVGNGWYRCSMSAICIASGTPGVRIQLLSGTNAIFAGNGTDGILVWGLQTVQGAVPGDYQETIATALPVQYVAPDGSVTADKVVPTTASGDHLVGANAGTAVSGTIYTLSAYAKRDGYNFIRLSLGNTAGGGFTFFNLSTGTIGATSGTLANEIVPVGNGWYRCSVRRAAVASAAIAGDIYVTSADNQFSWAGNGTDGVLVWGAQLSDSASLDPYVYNPVAAPTAAAYYGPRFDYDPATLAARGLLIEEQRTNSIRNNTMQGAASPSTFPTNWQSVIVSGITSTVIGTGVENGVTYLDVRVSGTPSASTFYNLVPDILVAGASGQTWAGSFWAKLVAGSFTNTVPNIELRESDAAQAFLANTITSISLSSTLTRYSLVRTLTNASTAFISVRSVWQLTNGLPVDFTLRIGLPQLELGAFATSVIPTTTAAATRTADTATMVGANFSNWYNQNAGTLYAEAATLEIGFASGGAFVLNVSDGTGSNLHRIFRQSDAQAVMQTLVGGATQTTFGFGATWTDTQPRKLTYAYALNDFAGAVNAGIVQTDTSGLLPTNSVMDIGCVGGGTQLNGYIRQVTYFPRRLANSELQTVTL